MEKRNALSFFLKDHRVGDPRTSSGREFQRVGASNAKLFPNCLADLCLEEWNLGTIRKLP